MARIVQTVFYSFFGYLAGHMATEFSAIVSAAGYILGFLFFIQALSLAKEYDLRK
jgi:hypothetical protein